MFRALDESRDRSRGVDVMDTRSMGSQIKHVPFKSLELIWTAHQDSYNGPD